MEVSPAPESSSIATFAHSTLTPTMILSEIGLLLFNLKEANVVQYSNVPHGFSSS